MTTRLHKWLAFLTCLPFLGSSAAPAHAQNWGVVSSNDDGSRRHRVRRHRRDAGYEQTLRRVTNMPNDGDLQNRARQLGLNVVNVMWEDTGRYEGSSVGPNISDVTLQVRQQTHDGLRTHLLPVIRSPNFSDRTGDVPIEKLWVRVGNQRNGGRVRAQPLERVLGDLREYVSDPDSLRGSGDFIADRDSHVLVSAQHVFVPLDSEGKAEFNPVIFNYQSYPQNPAVLTLLVTRQGTSAAVIENRSGDQTQQGWGQQLFFDNHGQRTAFTAERRSAVQARIERGEAEEQDQGALEEGADMMMLIQVPLVQRPRPRPTYNSYGGIGMLGTGMGGGGMGDMAMPAPAAAPMAESSAGYGRGGLRSNVETAVIGHGDDLGRYRGFHDLRLVRDERFPIRVTVQFYKATSNGVISNEDLEEAHRAIERVYEDADYVGSLVVPEGDRHRPTRRSHG